MNKKRCLIIIGALFLFFSIKSFSQEKLNGKYSNFMQNQDSYNYIIFNLNGTFEYENGGDLGIDFYGDGEYNIINDYLILNYNKTKPLPMSFYKNEVWQNNNDSISLSIKVYDFKGNKVIPKANVFLKSNSKYINNGLTDKNGFFSVKLKKDKMKIVEIISNEMFYTECTVDLRLDSNYNLRFYLTKSGNGTPIIGQIDSLKIKKIQKDKIEIIRSNKKIEIWKKIKE